MSIYFLEGADRLRLRWFRHGSWCVIRFGTGVARGFVIGAILAGEVAEIDLEFSAAHDTRIDGALNVAWESNAVPYLVIAHKSNLFQENGRRFNKLADFTDWHAAGGIDPNLPF